MTTRTDRERSAAHQFAQAARAAGYTVYMAARGRYGFYTDDAGARVVSFSAQGAFARIKVSCNYAPSRTYGSGAVLADDVDPATVQGADLARWITSPPARWGDPRPVYTPAAQYLGTYGRSSGFVPFAPAQTEEDT